MRELKIKEFLDAGVHFGHQTRRWNPMMKPFVYMEKGGIHIIDLKKSLLMCQKALEFVKQKASEGGKMIFIGTKKQAVEPIQKAAQSCGQFYVTKRWLGGTLTNFVTIKSSVDRLKKIDQMKEKGDLDFLSKKEKSRIEKERYQLNEYLNGIREMRENPSFLFVVDIVKERIAIKEAKRLNIPVVGIADTNCNPEEIDFPIPGNDDSIRSITLFSEMVAEAYREGEKEWEEKLKTDQILKAKEEEAMALELHKMKTKAQKGEAMVGDDQRDLKEPQVHHQSAEKMNPSTVQRKGKLSSKEYKEYKDKSAQKKATFSGRKDKGKDKGRDKKGSIEVIQKSLKPKNLDAKGKGEAGAKDKAEKKKGKLKEVKVEKK